MFSLFISYFFEDVRSSNFAGDENSVVYYPPPPITPHPPPPPPRPLSNGIIQATKRVLRLDGSRNWPQVSNIFQKMFPKPKRKPPSRDFQFRPRLPVLSYFRTPQSVYFIPQGTNGNGDQEKWVGVSMNPHHKPPKIIGSHSAYLHTMHQPVHGYQYNTISAMKAPAMSHYGEQMPMVNSYYPVKSMPPNTDVKQQPLQEFDAMNGLQTKPFRHLHRYKFIHANELAHSNTIHKHSLTYPSSSWTQNTQLMMRYPKKYQSENHHKYLSSYLTPPRTHSVPDPSEGMNNQHMFEHSGKPKKNMSTHFQVTRDRYDAEPQNGFWQSSSGSGQRRLRWAPLHAASYLAEGRKRRHKVKSFTDYQNVFLIPVLDKESKNTRNETSVVNPNNRE
ncbi:hypothetical protein FHG87_000160 [Trinorchestia longiramus]|nr:hypothetical protein FHG87_000160 [Trinorchestia longiramus]